MLANLTSTQLAEWEVYYSIDPESEGRQDFRLAYISSLLTNIVIKTFGKDGAKLTSVKDFILKWDKADETEKPAQNVEQLKEALMAWATSHNAAIDKEEKRRTKPPANWKRSKLKRNRKK